MTTKAAQLKKLNETMVNCSLCVLRSGCSKVVPGTGNPEAKIVFIGEAPGKKEAELGVPFVGAAGKFFDDMLAAIKMNRENVYITNICKCRPPENRDPLPVEIQQCTPWLEKEIAIINPELIITLGRHALGIFLPKIKITAIHGKTFESSIAKFNKYSFLALYHPAAMKYNENMRKVLMDDFKKIPKILQNKKERYSSF
jgi:DNA polymerase